MNNDNEDSRSSNEKYFERRVDCLGKLTPSDFNAFL